MHVFPIMKNLFVALLIIGSPTISLAENDTAYKALRVFGKQQGEKLLNRVTELRGRNGVPQPQVWRVTASDASARAGVIEVEVQRGKIISQRTPTSRTGSTGAIMDLNRLNLDSDGAFTVADREMQSKTIPFDRVDYLLRSSAQGQSPIWQLDLFDRGSKVATMHIAADTGSILDQEHFAPAGSSHGVSRDRDYVDGGHETRKSSNQGALGHVENFFRRMGNHFEKRGHQLKNFFTGDDN